MGGAPPLPLDFASQGPKKGHFWPFFGARESCLGPQKRLAWGPKSLPTQARLGQLVLWIAALRCAEGGRVIQPKWQTVPEGRSGLP